MAESGHDLRRAAPGAGIRLRHGELRFQGPLFRTERVRRCRPGGGEGRSSSPCGPSRKGTSPRWRPPRPAWPAALGIPAPDSTDWGEPLRPEPGESAVFRGCGLTALAALQASGVPLFATHAPGAMLVTDLPENVP